VHAAWRSHGVLPAPEEAGKPMRAPQPPADSAVHQAQSAETKG
jgi:hypothetical protein